MRTSMDSVRHVAARALPYLSACAILGVAGCSGDTTGVRASSASQLAFMATTSATASAAGAASASLAPITSGGHTLDLTSLSVSIASAELKGAKTDACPGDEDSSGEHASTATSTDACGELKIGPTTVDVPLTGSLVTVPANAIPAGTYREFELRVSQIEIKGTFDTKAFDVTIPVNARSEVEFATPLVVTDGTPASITVNIPVAAWLTNADGSLVNPSLILTTPSLMAQIKARILTSFRAFEDRNHDGHDSHGGHG